MAATIDQGMDSGNGAPADARQRSQAQEPSSVLDRMGKGNMLYVLPGLLIYAVFVFIPILAAVVISLTEWNGLVVPSFVGLQNYIKLFSDHEFYIALRNNAEFMVFYCVLPLAIGICLAAIISVVGKRERLVLRTLFFLPYIMPTAVLGIIFQWLYNPAFGPFNQILKAVGLGRMALPWLGDFTWALPSLGLIGTWVTFGFCMVLVVSGASSISTELYEAAKVDGAGPVREFFTVTLPGLRGYVAVALTLTITSALRTFDLVWVTTHGGPGTSTLTPAVALYRAAFQNPHVGAAAAIGIVMALLCLVIAMAIGRISEKD